MKDITTLPDACADCGQAREHRTCYDCRTCADVIDCGHYPQPAEIAASARDGRPTCAACEAQAPVTAGNIGT